MAIFTTMMRNHTLQLPRRWFARESRARSMEETPATDAVPAESLWRLILVFFQVGATSLGGKPSAFIFDALVRRRGWLLAEDFVEGQTLSRLLPGATANTLVIFIAQRLHGALAALACLAASALPGILIILIMSVLSMSSYRPPWLEGAVHAVAAAAVGLLFANMVQIVPTARAVRAWHVIAVLAFAANGIMRWNVFLVFLVLGSLSLYFNRPRSKGGK
jgi:chromate transporter